MTNKLMLLNGNIYTIDSKNSKAEALAVLDGNIIGVGTNLEIQRLCGEGWRSINLQGKAVLPGFIDSHVHFMSTAITAIGINLAEARSIAEILSRVDERVRQTPLGEWIFGYFITHLSDRGMPTRFDLDRISTRHPIRVTYLNGHVCSLNTMALELLRVPRDVEGVESVAGELTGVIRDPAILAIPRSDFLIDEERRFEALRLASHAALEKGVTTLHALGGGAKNLAATVFLLQVKDRLPIGLIPTISP
jgi:predicted amidohydrolase YtcJ